MSISYALEINQCLVPTQVSLILLKSAEKVFSNRVIVSEVESAIVDERKECIARWVSDSKLLGILDTQ